MLDLGEKQGSGFNPKKRSLGCEYYDISKYWAYYGCLRLIIDARHTYVFLIAERHDGCRKYFAHFLRKGRKRFPSLSCIY